jgi:hypothetical protein
VRSEVMSMAASHSSRCVRLPSTILIEVTQRVTDPRSPFLELEFRMATIRPHNRTETDSKKESCCASAGNLCAWPFQHESWHRILPPIVG